MPYIVDFFALCSVQCDAVCSKQYDCAVCSVQLSHRGSQVEEMLVAHEVVASHKKMYTPSIVAIAKYSSPSTYSPAR